MEKEQDINITPESSQVKVKEVWEFQNRVVPIIDMGKLAVLKASLHAMKRIHYWNNQVNYYNNLIEETDNDQKIATCKMKLQEFNEKMLNYADKLEDLEYHAEEHLGFEVPENFEDIKKLLDYTRESYKK